MKIKLFLLCFMMSTAFFAQATFTTIYTTSTARFASNGYQGYGNRSVVITPSGIIGFAFHDGVYKYMASNDLGSTWTTPSTLNPSDVDASTPVTLDVMTNSLNDLYFSFFARNYGIMFDKYTHTGAPTSTTWTSTAAITVNATGSPVAVQDSTSNIWVVYKDGAAYYSKKSTDTDGQTWGTVVTVFNGSMSNWDGIRAVPWSTRVSAIFGESYDKVSWRYNDGSWQTPILPTVSGGPAGYNSKLSIMSTTDNKMYFASGPAGNYGTPVGVSVYNHDDQTANGWNLMQTVSTVAEDNEPVLTTTGTDVWVFWREYVASSQYNIVYKRYFDGGWSTKTTLITDGLNNYQLSVPARCTNGFIPLIWKEGSGVNYEVHRLKMLKIIVPPVVTNCAPLTADNAASQTITITGKGFFGGTGSSNVTVVRLDDPEATSLTSLTAISDTVITGVVPSLLIAGTYNIQATNTGGTNSTSTVKFVVTSTMPAPTVTSFTPVNSISINLSTLSINGTDFFGGTASSAVKKIQILSTPATDLTGYSVVSTTVITGAVIPNTVSPGSYNIRVSTAGGSGSTGTYVISPPTPLVTTVTPLTANNKTQMESIVITGQYFFGGTATTRVQSIKLGNIINPPILVFLVDTDTTIQSVLLPAGSPPGTYDMAVQIIVSGMSAVNTTSAQKFIVTTDLPTVTNINPVQVYNTTGGTVTVTGTGFYAGTNPAISTLVSKIDVTKSTGGSVTSIISAGYSVISDSQITGCFIPSGLPLGTYDLRVYNDGPNCNATSGLKLRVTTPPPVVTSITPNTATNLAARTLSINGTGFAGGIGTNDVSSVKLVSGTTTVTISSYTVKDNNSDSIMYNLIVPADTMSGAYDVIVTNSGGTGSCTTKYYCTIDGSDPREQTIINSDTSVVIQGGDFGNPADVAVVIDKNIPAVEQTKVDTANAVKYSNMKLRANLGAWTYNVATSISNISIYPSTATINPNKEVTLSVSFAGFGITDSYVKNSLRIVTLNGSRWEVVSGTQTVNETTETVSVAVPHFSIFRLAQLVSPASNLDGVVVFPNPLDFSTSVRNTVKFTGLTLDPLINIYTLSGELVRTLEPDSASLYNDGASGRAEWDGKNTAGELVQRGMYVYLVKDDAGRKKVGKIVIR